MAKRWLTRQEAAKMLKCSPARISTIAREMREAGIEGVDSNGVNFLRIDPDALRAYLPTRRRKRYTWQRGA